MFFLDLKAEKREERNNMREKNRISLDRVFKENQI